MHVCGLENTALYSCICPYSDHSCHSRRHVCHDKLLFTLPVFVMLRWSYTYVLTHVGLELH